jgi:hypothetical protein
MKKTKFNPQLLNEELKRFRLLNEYSFYTEKETSDYEKPLILGTDLEEADEDPNATDPNQDAAAGGDVNDMGGEDGLSDETPANANPEAEADNMGDDMPPAPPGTEEPTEDDLDFGVGAEDPAAEDPAAEEPAVEEPVDDSVEIDVSELVKGSEEAKEAAEKAEKESTKVANILMNKLSDLEAKLARMDAVTAKIDGLEKEIIKRNPTPVEKLEMRSLSSYPYSQKLTDYWSDKEGAYDVMHKDDKPKEYVLTKDDIDSTYSDSSIRNSFDADDYEEEDI